MTTFEHYALVIPNGYSQLSFRHTNTMTPDELICTIGIDHSPDAVLSQSELDDLRDLWVNEVVDNLSSATTFVRVDASDAGGVYRTSLSGAVGTTVASMAALNNAVIVRKVTGVSGRRNSGRLYLPAVGEAVVDEGGNLTALFVDGIQSSFDAIQAAVEADVSFPTGFNILHSKGWDGVNEPADPGNAPAPTPITGFAVQNKIGTQRRRLR